MKTSSAEQVQKGQELIVTIKRIGINGEGVGYFRRKAVFVENALPDEVVLVRVTEVSPTYMKAVVVKREKTSKHRQTPDCPVYERCGGCQMQHMTYEAQLQAKEELVAEAFYRYCSIHRDQLPLKPMIGMEHPWHYRNKAQWQVSKVKGKLFAGLYQPASHNIVDLTGCPVENVTLNKVMKAAKQALKESKLPIFQDKPRSEGVRSLVGRISEATGEIQLIIVTSAQSFPEMDTWVKMIRERLPEVNSISQNIQSEATPLVMGFRTTLLWGRKTMREKLGSLRFQLSPRAFFQINPKQTTALYDAAKAAARLTGQENIADLYCGTGTIALWLAEQAKEVRGVESIRDAVEDARKNAALNGIGNVQFEAGKAEERLPLWIKKGYRPDVIVLDPPRSGCHPEVLESIIKSRTNRIVYISCNPATLAKDCEPLLRNGYRLESIQPVDMFPQTSHVETVVALTKAKKMHRATRKKR